MTSSDVVSLLRLARNGEQGAADRLFSTLYEDLKRLARAQLRRAQAPKGTLDTTALVHEAYIRLIEPAGLAAEDRAHFFNLAARVMRHVMADFARRRGAAKRGADLRVTWPDGFEPAVDVHGSRVLAIDEALERLERESARLAQLVELRFFAGLSIEEVAVLQNVSDRTVKRDWRRARAFLLAELG